MPKDGSTAEGSIFMKPEQEDLTPPSFLWILLKSNGSVPDGTVQRTQNCLKSGKFRTVMNSHSITRRSSVETSLEERAWPMRPAVCLNVFTVFSITELCTVAMTDAGISFLANFMIEAEND